MKTIISVFLIVVSLLLIIASFNLVIDSIMDKPQSAEVQRIEAPEMLEEYSIVRIDKAQAPEVEMIALETITLETQYIEEPVVEAITLEAKPIEVPSIEIDRDVPLDDEIQLTIAQMCEERDVDKSIILAMIHHESRYNESAIGDNGKAFGLMQIQPRWHQERIDRLGVTDLLDGSQNVAVGIDFLDELLDTYDGSYEKALTAYNSGHYRGVVTNYAKTILQEANK